VGGTGARDIMWGRVGDGLYVMLTIAVLYYVQVQIMSYFMCHSQFYFYGMEDASYF